MYYFFGSGSISVFFRERQILKDADQAGSERLTLKEFRLNQWRGSGSGRIHIPFGPWIRIQRYKMKRKAEFNQPGFFFLYF